MGRTLISFFALAVLALPVFAQEGEDDGRPERRGGRRGGRGDFSGRMMARLVEELDLDEEQLARVEELTATHRERMQQTRELWAELRAAERDGNRERAVELRAQMADGENPWDSMRQVLDEVEPILTDEQYDRFMDMRDEMDRRREEGERRREARESYEQMVEELPDKLNLDDAQREAFGKLLETRSATFRERMEQMRPLWQQMREAREAGDQARIEELTRQVEELRPDPDAFRADFLEQVEGLLNDTQKPLLAEYRGQLAVVTEERPLRPADVRDILTAARRVELEREQRRRLRLIAREALRDAYKIDRKDKDAQAALAASVKEKIAGMLEQEQLKAFERQIERARSARPARS